MFNHDSKKSLQDIFFIRCEKLRNTFEVSTSAKKAFMCGEHKTTND